MTAPRLVVAVLLALALPALASATPSVVVRRTEHGIPHVVADTDRGVGYGYGYAVAQDHLCLLAEAYVTVAGERSRYFGPEAIFDFYANGAKHPNLDSDLYYRAVLASGAIGRALSAPPPVGLRSPVKQLVRGYVAGYNRYLADRGGSDGVRDPACHGKPWVKPITAELAYARFMQIASLAGGGLAITGIGEAQPPVGGGPSGAAQPDPGMITQLGDLLGLNGTGSNAVALGSEATRSGHGMVLGNPHLPWEGDGRLYEAQLTIPGKLDVEGATFIGVPLVVIGHTRALAWSHTTSSAFRFTPYELTLVPGDPTSYLVDGAPEKMTTRDITVPLQGKGTVTRTLYSTRYGPMLTELLGLPLFPWTAATGFAFADANAENLRYLNHFYETDRAQSTRRLEAILRRNQGIPWANTVAADRRGRALYADASVVPAVSDDLAQSCNTAMGVATFAQLRLPVLDGSRAACAWAKEKDAVVPGIFGPGHLPFLARADYVENSNDSYWLTNPAAPLTGFARIIGDERTERSLRTRLALRMLREHLADGGRLTRLGLQRLLLSDRNGAGELMRDALVSLCRSLPVLPSTAGPVDPADACDVLAKWDLHEHLDSAGSILFRRWEEHALKRPIPGANAVGGGSPMDGTWSDAFDPDRPVDTPSELNTANPALAVALGDAVSDLRGAGIALDAAPGAVAFAPHAGEPIPLHGGPGADGIFDAVDIRWQADGGYGRVVHGSSFVMAAELRGACPPTRTVVTYSQSSDRTSPWYRDQTRMFSAGRWVRERYCAGSVLRSPALHTQRLGCLPATERGGPARIAGIAPGLTRARVRRIAGTGRRWCAGKRGSVRVVLRGGRVALVASTALRAGGRRLTVRRIARHRFAITGPGWVGVAATGRRQELRRLAARAHLFTRVSH